MREPFYKLILKQNNAMTIVYLDQNSPRILKVGTTPTCDLRLHHLGAEVEFAFYLNQERWSFSLNDLPGITVVRHEGAKYAELTQCEVQDKLYLSICRRDGSSLREMLAIMCELHYDFTDVRFDHRITLESVSSLTVGGSGDCHVQIQSGVVGSGKVRLLRQGESWRVEPQFINLAAYLNETPLTVPSNLFSGDFLTLGDVRLFYQDNVLYLDARLKAQCGTLPNSVIVQSHSALPYPIFVRSTRVQHQIKTDEIKVLMPKSKPQEERENFLLKILPPATMLVAMLAMRSMSGSSGMTMLLYTGASMGVSMLVMLLSRRDSKKYRAEDENQRKKRYYDYIQNKIEEITLRRQDELRILERIYRSLGDNIAIVQNFEKGLFDRAPGDVDFMDVRLGSGKREAAIKVTADIPEYKELDDELQDKAQEIVDKYRILEDAPVVARLNNLNAIGIVGQRRWMYELLKTMTTDLATRQYYKELKIYYVIDEEDQPDFTWARWLRNCVNNESATYRNILCDQESTKFHLEVLYRLLSEREMAVQSDKNEPIWPEYFVVFVYRVDIVRNHPISQYFERCGRLGFRFVFMDEHEELLPRGCGQLIRLDRKPSEGSLIYTMDGGRPYAFNYPQIMDERMMEIVRKLCKVHVVEANLANEMVKSITLYELLKIKKAEELQLSDIWANSHIEKSMSVPLGVRSKNIVVNLDLHDSEKAHGPHGLVAGTTGSGKSEILQTYIINMSIFYHPYEVNFLLIDFKGGGMANQFRGLPHLSGCITDIDGREINRSLKSIKAELERRKRLFAQVEVNKIHDYISMYKRDPKSVPAPLPHLIIIVDEFAELRAEQPDFMKELISAARIGRSLGVHLILATQKPSGVVDAQIWSNSRFKLCLKVQTKEDSQEMIKTPLAAEIREPGRAYLQVGNNEVFELFQSAYSGGSVPNLDPNAVQPFKINELNMWGMPKTVYEVAAPKDEKSGEVKKPETQLDALVKYIDGYCDEIGLTPLPSIILPPLPQRLLAEDLRQTAPHDRDVIITAALYDDPENQTQDSYQLNLSTSNTWLIGAAQMGKTSALQSILVSAIRQYDSSRVNFYVIDGGNMAMNVFTGSKYVGGIAGITEEEKIRNLFKLMTRTVAERKDILLANGVGTHSSYLEMGKRDMPLIVLVIDNIAAFREYYEQYDDVVQMLAREGLSVGISLLVTGSASNNMSYRTSSNFATQICFTCNDTSEYATVMHMRDVEPFNYPGRALVPLGKRVVEAQFILPNDGASESERTKKIKEFLAMRNQTATMTAEPIPMVPDSFTLTEEMAKHPASFKQPYEIVIAMAYDTVEYVTIHLDQIGSLVINGSMKSNKHMVVRSIMKQIQNQIFIHRTEAIVCDSGPRHTLGSLRTMSCVTSYVSDPADIQLALQNLYQELEERERMLYSQEDDEEREALIAQWPLKLLIVNDDAALKTVLDTKECAKQVHDMLTRFAECRCCVIWCGYPNKRTGLSDNELKQFIGSQGTFLFMDYLQNLRMTEVNLATQRKMVRPYVLGDAYWHFDEELTHVRVLSDE